MITELTLIKRHGVTMTRADVCEALHVAPNTLRNWVSTGRFPRHMHESAKDGPIWPTQVVARYIDDQVTQAA